MKILLITTFYPPTNSIASHRPLSWAKCWSRLGHSVTVLTTKKTAHETDEPLYSHENLEIIEADMPDAIQQAKSRYRAPGSSSAGKSGILSFLKKKFQKMRDRTGIFNACRMPDFTDFWILPALRKMESKEPYDVIISTAGPYSVHIVAYKLKKKWKNSFWIADYRDTWSDNYIYPGMFPFNVCEKILEKHLLKKADLLTTISEPFAEHFKKKYPGKIVETVYNGYDPEDEVDPEPSFPDDGKYRIVHTGSLYLQKRDPSPLFLAIKELKEDKKTLSAVSRLEVIFVGLQNANLEELIQKYGLEDMVKLGGFVSRKKALAMQRDADALLFLPWNDPSTEGVLTGKIFEYLSSKTPIICVGCQQKEASQNLILEANAGKAFHDVKEIKTFLTQELLSLKKTSCQPETHVLQRFERPAIAKNLLDTIELYRNKST